MTRAQAPAPRALGQWLVALAGAGTLVHGLYTLGMLGGPAVVYDAYVYLGIMAAAALACALRVVGMEPGERRPWLVLSAAVAIYLLASLYWQAVISHLPEEPYPTLADAGWLAFYPVAYAGLVLLTRAGVARISPSAWLDGIVGGMAVAAVVAAVAFERITEDLGADPLAVATNLAYPVLDLLLLGLVVGSFAATGWRLSRSWLALGAGLVALGAADSLYLYGIAAGTYTEGEWLDTLWPLGITLIAGAAWASDERMHVRYGDGRIGLLLTLAFTLLALALLLFGALSPDSRLNPLAAVAATLTLVAACVRTGMAFADLTRAAESRRQALTDELTGLPNRRAFHREGHEAVEDARGHGVPVGALLLDLDGFKEVNDTLGHDAGDQLLRQIGPRLREALAPGDVLARLGGDEFAVLLPGRDPQAAMAVALGIRQALERPFDVEELALVVDASVGVTAFPDHADSVEDLLQRADVAMYQAKASRTGAELYASGNDANSRDRLTLLSDLRRGIDHGELVVHYQPQACVATGEVRGFEALVRWQHPERGLLGPGEFLPAAEQTGLMRAVTLEVVDQALGCLAQWREREPALEVSVNLAVVNMLDRELPAAVARALARHGAEPGSLILEVTENVVMADPQRAAVILGELRAMGVGISLDDFGTGHSSLAWLQSLPVDELKVDRAFTFRITEDPATAAIVRATLQMATALELRTVAEGAEDDETWALLDSYGCDRVQGYVLSRPLPPGEVAGWLAARRLVAPREPRRRAGRPA